MLKAAEVKNHCLKENFDTNLINEQVDRGEQLKIWSGLLVLDASVFSPL